MDHLQPGRRVARELPTGTVTFLFTDIEGSTHLLQRLGDRYPAVLEDHYRILRDAAAAHDGVEVGTAGDALFLVFERGADAVAAAVDAQLALLAHPWPGDDPLRVRVGIHTGEAAVVEGGYAGLPVNQAARICAAGHGAQILTSEATRLVVGDAGPAGVEFRDLGYHRLKDLPEPERLYQVVHGGLPGEFPGLRLDAMPGNLPKQITTFVGRHAERTDAALRLRAGARLLTLTGSGGCGKTRLALQVAAQVVDEYTHGAWLVELASVLEPHLVAQTVAGTLEVREESGRPLEATLAGAIGGKRMLLILDNCEHLVVACAELVEVLLRSCPGLQILATSQEALGIFGEAVLRVPSLSFPAEDTDSALSLAPYESAQLFADRAALRRPGFEVTDDNAAAVAQICRRLEGIPLAIELAAARITVLSPQQIAARLDDQFRLLTGGSRSALPRQQTLRAAVEWSVGLLGESERAVLRRLAVFAGGWTLEAASAVCVDAPGAAGDDGTATATTEADMLDVLDRLVGRSLLVVEEQDGEARYRLLESIRQFAREKLVESGEATELRSRHLDWCTAMAAGAEPELTGPDQARWLARLAVEYDNMRAAMEWASSHPAGAGRFLWLTAALWRFWLVRGEWSEGRAWLRRALETSAGERSPTRARALAAAGDLATEQGDYEEAERLLQESLELWDDLGDVEGRAKTLNHLGNLARSRFDYAEARRLLTEALELRRAAGNQRGMAVSLRNLGLVAALQRDHEAARRMYEGALTLARAVGEKRVVATVTHALSEVLIVDGDWVAARRLAEEGLAIARELGDGQGIAEHLVVLAGIAGCSAAAKLSEPDRPAAAMVAEALDLWQALGSRDAEAWAQSTLGNIALAAGDVDRARDHYEAALRQWREVGDVSAVASHLNLAGWAAMLGGDRAAALAWLEEGLDLARAVGDSAQLSGTLHSRAELARLEGALDEADALVREAMAVSADSGWTLRWWPMLTCATIARQRGDLDGAAALLAEAAELVPAVGRRPGLAAMLEEAAAIRAAAGDPTGAAERLGAAAALRSAGPEVPPAWKPALDALRAEVEHALGPDRFEAAFGRGAEAEPEALVRPDR